MNIFRPLAGLFIFFSFFFLPGFWWIVLLLIFSLVVPFYFEGLFFALWYDLFYGPLSGLSFFSGRRTDFFLFAAVGLVIILSLLFRDRFSAGRARKNYLR